MLVALGTDCLNCITIATQARFRVRHLSTAMRIVHSSAGQWLRPAEPVSFLASVDFQDGFIQEGPLPLRPRIDRDYPILNCFRRSILIV